MSQRVIIEPVIRSIALVALLGMPGMTWAIDEIQQRDIALIQSQLAQIIKVLNRLDVRQSSQTYSDDLYLDVPRLRQDLDRIQGGLDHYLSPNRQAPRQLPPIELDDLAGDYLRRAQQ